MRRSASVVFDITLKKATSSSLYLWLSIRSIMCLSFHTDTFGVSKTSNDDDRYELREKLDGVIEWNF